MFSELITARQPAPHFPHLSCERCDGTERAIAIVWLSSRNCVSKLPRINVANKNKQREGERERKKCCSPSFLADNSLRNVFSVTTSGSEINTSPCTCECSGTGRCLDPLRRTQTAACDKPGASFVINLLFLPLFGSWLDYRVEHTVQIPL